MEDQSGDVISPRRSDKAWPLGVRINLRRSRHRSRRASNVLQNQRRVCGQRHPAVFRSCRVWARADARPRKFHIPNMRVPAQSDVPRRQDGLYRRSCLWPRLGDLQQSNRRQHDGCRASDCGGYSIGCCLDRSDSIARLPYHAHHAHRNPSNFEEGDCHLRDWTASNTHKN